MNNPFPLKYRNLPEQFAKLKAAYFQAATVAASLRDDTDEHMFSGDVHCWRWNPTEGRDNSFDAICERLVQVLCWHGEKTLAAPGARLQIDHRSIMEPFRTERDTRSNIDNSRYDYLDTFGPEAVWGEITRRFGGDRGHAVSLVNAAAVIRDTLQLAHGRPIKTVAGRIELEMPVYSEKARRGFRLSLGSGEQVAELFAALVVVSRNDPEAPPINTHVLMAIPRQLSDYSGVTSRSVFECGAVDIHCYSRKLVLRLTKTYAERLNVFITEHTTAAEAA